MRLRERDKRAVTLYPFTGMDEDVYTWGKGQVVRAALYPAGTALASQVYGETVTDSRLMLSDGDVKLEVGIGVSLDGGAPTLRIAALEAWSHGRAQLEEIEEGRRGVVS